MRLTALITTAWIAPVSAGLLATPVAASSDEAWETFRADVARVCADIAGDDPATEIEVNAFGSEHYGAALVTTHADDGTRERSVCIYDKQAGTAEMTAPFDPVMPDKGEAASPEASPE